jgi:hypothetical protein
VSDWSLYPTTAPGIMPLILGIELGGYLSEPDIDLLRFLRLYHAYHQPKSAAARTARPTPTPIPILAPVDRPPLPPPLDESACVVGFSPGATDVVYGDMSTIVVAGDEETTNVVTVIWLITPSEVVATTSVDSIVVDENDIDDEVDVMVVGSSEVPRTTG